MLSASEILELEKKVFRYRLKRNIFFYGLLALLISSLVILSLTFYMYPSFFKNFLHVKTQDPVELNQSVKTLLVENNATQVTEENVTTDSKEATLVLSPPKVQINKEVSSSKEIFKSLPKESKESTLATTNEPFYRSVEEKIDTSVLTPPSFEMEKPKGMIKIESQDVHSIPQLKEKFEKTQNIVFALMLAEEFYNAKNYKESVTWSLMANQSDPENEKSWIWFAKSKIKLGEKEDAITALKAFLKHNKSRAAQTLLNQINLGELHE